MRISPILLSTAKCIYIILSTYIYTFDQDDDGARSLGTLVRYRCTRVHARVEQGEQP